MSYLGNPVQSAAFLTDQFSGNGSTTAFTLSVAPATSASILVSISGVLQDPTVYAISGTTITFSGAPPAGTGNISVRYLGIPAAAIATTAYRTVTEFTASAGQTTFTTPSYTIGFINVYLNGVRLASDDFTANSGTYITLTVAASIGDSIVTESFYVSSVLNALPTSGGTIGGNLNVSGTQIIGSTGALGGATNPIVGMTASANNYVQSYIVNKNTNTNASADFCAYPDNGTDATGWADMGITSSTYNSIAFSVTGPNESYLFGSAPATSGKTGNLVIATDSTGTANAIQFYTNGFNKAKGAWASQIDKAGIITNQYQPAMFAQPDSSTTFAAGTAVNCFGWNTSGSIRFNRGFTIGACSTPGVANVANGGATGRITVPATGVYALYIDQRCEAKGGSGTTYGAQARIAINGTQYIRRHITQWGDMDYSHCVINAMLNLAANDYIEIGFWWNNVAGVGGALAGTGDTVNWMYLAKIA